MTLFRIKDSKKADVMNDDLVYRVGDDKSTTAKEWFRGEHCNFIPSKANLAEENAVEKYVLHGWLPEAPLIGPDTVVTAFGSCFAQYIRKHLIGKAQMGHPIEDHQPLPIINNGEAINTTFAVLQQFLWAWEGENFDGVWHGRDANLVVPTEEMRQDTKAVFDKTDVFILTLGLSEVWCDAETGQVFWRAVPKEGYDPSKHKFRVSTVEENRENIAKIVHLINKHTNAKIIFTLSPVPLNATFRPISCITANSVSKAILRVAVDEVMRATTGNVYYWPAYDVVKDFFPDAFREDNRHPKDEIVAFILKMFSRYYVHA